MLKLLNFIKYNQCYWIGERIFFLFLITFIHNSFQAESFIEFNSAKKINEDYHDSLHFKSSAAKPDELHALRNPSAKLNNKILEVKSNFITGGRPKNITNFVQHHEDGGEIWGYFPDNGPEHWPQACRDGFRQSPIDIRASNVEYSIINEMHFVNYDKFGTVYVKNTGHGMQIDGFDRFKQQNRPYIYGGGLNGKYMLSQFHFHWSYTHDDGSEHTIGTLHYPVEIHFVHTKDGYSTHEVTHKPDGLAVVAVFLTLSNDATALTTLDSGIRKVINKGDNTMIFNYTAGVNLPSNLENFYRYSGSLTTPGCNEAVIWTIMAEPVGITEAQLNTLREVKIGTRKKLPDSNSRPVQSINGRKILYRSTGMNREKICGIGSNDPLRNLNGAASSYATLSALYFTIMLNIALSVLCMNNIYV